MKKAVVTCLVYGILLNVASFSYGESEDMAIGFLIRKSPTSITIQQSDYSEDADAFVDVTYQITPKTDWQNVASIDKLKVKDELSVEYEEKDGENIALSVYVFNDDGEYTEEI